MSQPYIGEIRTVGFNFAPAGWALCNGQLMSIVDNAALFSILGTTYGGNGTTTFALPDLQGRVPIHQGTDASSNTYPVGAVGGVEDVTLSTGQIPAHTHALSNVSANQSATSHAGTTNTPSATNVSAQAVDSLRQPVKMYSTAAGTTTLAPIQPTGATQQDGGGQPHSNLQPSLVINYVISLFGTYPSRN